LPPAAARPDISATSFQAKSWLMESWRMESCGMEFCRMAFCRVASSATGALNPLFDAEPAVRCAGW
jgi:hypothetical protein